MQCNLSNLCSQCFIRVEHWLLGILHLSTPRKRSLLLSLTKSAAAVTNTFCTQQTQRLQPASWFLDYTKTNKTLTQQKNHNKRLFKKRKSLDKTQESSHHLPFGFSHFFPAAYAVHKLLSHSHLRATTCTTYVVSYYSQPVQRVTGTSVLLAWFPRGLPLMGRDQSELPGPPVQNRDPQSCTKW